jgi:NADPH:quinone reductase-like Zn-dependent oxidoreductase
MKYRRVVIDEFGGPEVLKLIESTTGELKPEHVRVQVKATGLVWADTMMRTGLYPAGKLPAFPFTPGYDMVGVVVESAESNPKFKPGELVTGLVNYGGQGELLDVNAEILVHVPDGVPALKVACLGLNHITAYQMIHRRARLRRGETVLIYGAGGGVGTAFLQLGALLGLKIIGTDFLWKHDAIRKFGGIPIDFQREDISRRVNEIAPAGLDAVFDPLGGSSLARSFDLLKPGGRLVAYGEYNLVGSGKRNLEETKINVDFLASHKEPVDGKTVSFYECIEEVYKHLDWYYEDLGTMLSLIKLNKINPVIGARLPLQEISRAHELLMAHSVIGKIVLEP